MEYARMRSLLLDRSQHGFFLPIMSSFAQPSLKLQPASKASEDTVSSDSHSVLRTCAHHEFNCGDDRLRQRDTRHCLLLIGMAAVPVTHMLHTIDAENGILAKAREIAGKVRLTPQLVPVLA